MADLSYNDVQRAVQDSTRNVQNDLQRVSNILITMSQQLERVNDIEAAVRELQRTAVTLQNSLINMRSGTTSRPADPRISQLTADVHDLRVRFAVIEKFASQMSEYVQARYDDEQEDRQYRAA